MQIIIQMINVLICMLKRVRERERGGKGRDIYRERESILIISVKPSVIVLMFQEGGCVHFAVVSPIVT